MSLTQDAIYLLNQTGWQTPAEVTPEDLGNTNTVVRPIYHNASVVAYYIAPRPQLEAIDRVKLLAQLNASFGLEEVKTLAFQLGLDPDQLPQENRDVMARELLIYLQRRKQLPELLQLVQRERPHENWGGLPERY